MTLVPTPRRLDPAPLNSREKSALPSASAGPLSGDSVATSAQARTLTGVVFPSIHDPFQCDRTVLDALLSFGLPRQSQQN
ncbi:hypothetical protein ElyMa_003498300 [Elysia marginata]|uniref:Uncharacterized protein n=1 Tax=Elysia marginata TaxID=1093978 RepID=A0AAV4EE35_9GAST|nr:hypothetical protein ElyMa_003498300 [Elysia marginata]